MCFCFCFLSQVQAVLRRHWNQYKIQFEHSFSHSDAMRTASYTVSSISDVQGYGYNHDCTSEHLNGKSYHDMESVVLKTEKLYGWLPKTWLMPEVFTLVVRELEVWFNDLMARRFFLTWDMFFSCKQNQHIFHMYIYICLCFFVSI